MAKCVPCLSARVKEAIINSIDDEPLATMIDDIAECEDGLDIDLCGRKRRLSPYTQFASECMKQDKTMRECAIEWKRRGKK